MILSNASSESCDGKTGNGVNLAALGAGVNTFIFGQLTNLTG